MVDMARFASISMSDYVTMDRYCKSKQRQRSSS
jgi:hypothetical protein